MEPARTSLVPKDSERAVLGAIMLDPEQAATAVAAGLTTEHFGYRQHRALWDLLQQRYTEGLPTDSMSLFELGHSADQDAKWWDQYGGVTYLLGHPDRLPSLLLIDRSIRQIIDAWQRRGLRTALQTHLAALDAPDTDRAQLVEDLLADVQPLGARAQESTQATASLADEIDLRLDAEASGQHATFMATGLRQWDDQEDWQGITTEGVTLVLATSGMGKTSMLNRLVIGQAQRGVRVYLHGSETTRRRRATDMIFSLSGANPRRWAWLCRVVASLQARGMGAPQREELEHMRTRLHEAADEFARLPITISGAGFTVEQLGATARHLHRQGTCQAIYVDYLQDLRDSRVGGLRVGDRTAQVGYKSNQLKEICASLSVPLVVAAQVSGEKQGPGADPRPAMWDCQWSSGAHQDAEEVLALFRADYYRERDPRWGGTGSPGMMEIIRRKGRMGALSTIEVPFDGPTKWVGDRPQSYAPHWQETDHG